MPELHYLLFLLNATNLIFSAGKKLFDLFPNIEELFSKDTNLKELGLSFEEINKIKHPDWSLIEQDLRWVEVENNHIITINDDSYPDLLKEIQNPPLLLFIIGNLHLLKSIQIAIVGSRNPTPIGAETAFDFAKELVCVGATITSGLAAGIDAASHKGALSAVGKTIAVMGTGLNLIYPRSNTKLAQEIVDLGGALISEFPLNIGGKAWHFPMRNRIISGLSVGTLVVEATMRSGSLITARLAGEQGRDVFAIPNSIYNSKARGCHHLIRQGAKLVEQPVDILEEFSHFFQPVKSDLVNGKKPLKKNKLDRSYNKLLDCMGFEMTTIDVLSVRMSLSVSQISNMILELEMQDLVEAKLGGYIRVLNR